MDALAVKAKATRDVDLFYGGDPQFRTLESLANASAYNDWVFFGF
jgi:hypothetical protein